MSGWWWLSFCDTTKPEGSQFLGVAIVEASDPVAAVVVAHAKGCNPGGQVAPVGPLPDEALPSVEWRYRVLSRVEAGMASRSAPRHPL